LLHHCVHLSLFSLSSLFFFTATPPTQIYTLSLHDALPIFEAAAHGPEEAAADVEAPGGGVPEVREEEAGGALVVADRVVDHGRVDRKSTRLNSSHGSISYAVFCLKKKKQRKQREVEGTVQV